MNRCPICGYREPAVNNRVIYQFVRKGYRDYRIRPISIASADSHHGNSSVPIFFVGTFDLEAAEYSSVLFNIPRPFTLTISDIPPLSVLQRVEVEFKNWGREPLWVGREEMNGGGSFNINVPPAL